MQYLRRSILDNSLHFQLSRYFQINQSHGFMMTVFPLKFSEISPLRVQYLNPFKGNINNY